MPGTSNEAPNGALTVSFRLGSRREWIDPMQEMAETIFDMAGFDAEESYWPILAVREAVMNAVLHGNLERDDRSVNVEYRLSDEDIEVRVRDQGEGFDPTHLRDPLSSENLLSEGGRGVYLMRQFMDQVNFSFPDGGGTCISLVKKLPGKAADPEA